MITNSEYIQIIKKEKTPTYIFDRNVLIKRVKKIKEILGDNISLCYSIKANPFLVVELSDFVDKFEVCSPGELQICKNIIEINSNKIVYSGVNKTYDNINEAYETGVGEYTAESIQQLEIINRIARENKTILPVLLRLDSGSQFGIGKDDIIKIIKDKDDKYKNIDILGIHYFVGTQRENVDFDKQKKELNELSLFYQEVEHTLHYKLRRLEYGPGLPVPLYETGDYSDTLRPLKLMIDTLNKIASDVELTIEMGRFIVTDCGFYITKVVDKKTINNNNYAIVDGGINHVNYFGQIMGMKNPVIWHLDNNGNIIDEKNEEWKICGSLCTTNDNLVREYKTSHINIGDYLIFCNIGAYSVTEGIYLFLSRMLPKIIVYNGDGKYVIRRDFIETSSINTPQLSEEISI